MTARRILVVDDEPAVRRAVEKALSRAGYHVLCASSGEQACEILLGDTVDAVLMDLRMPSMSGRTLYHVILSQWPYLSSRVAVMSGDVEGDDEREWLEMYRLPVITKPFELAAIVRIVERLSAPEERRQANGL